MAPKKSSVHGMSCRRLMHKHSNVIRDLTKKKQARVDEEKGTILESTTKNPLLGLLHSMSLDDKIGQMAQIDISKLTYHTAKDELTLNQTAVDFFIGKLGVGSVVTTIVCECSCATQYRKIAVAIQKTARKYNRPPVIWGIDSVHGASYVNGAVVSPQPINLAATFNVSVAVQVGKLASRDTRAAGLNWIFAPLFEIGLEPRWSRIYETFGEDPVIVRIMANAMTEGIQEKDTTPGAIPSQAAACAKHFIGYSMPINGHDRAPSWIPRRHLYQYFVPPWKNLTAMTVMESYSEYDGVPNVANHESLYYLLRQRLNFDGVLLTDFRELHNMRTWHRNVETDQDAVIYSLRQGSVDMGMIPYHFDGFADSVRAGVEQNMLHMERIDKSVLRMLQLKHQLNMFTEELVEEDPNLKWVGTDQEAVLHMAHQSIILVKNENDLLPLTFSNESILVTGPTSSSLIYQSGGWTWQWQGAPEEDVWFTYGTNVLDAMKQETDWDIVYSCGTNILGGECEDGNALRGWVGQVVDWEDIHSGVHSSIDRAAAVASSVNTILVCVGEEAYAEKPGDIRSMRLPQGQYELVRRLRNSNPSARIVLLYFGGRPRLLKEMVEHSDAVLIGFLPGPSAGTAVVDLLRGRVNPSGRLPITYPMYEDGGGSPYYRSVSSKCTTGSGILPHWLCGPCEVQWKFGHGLSYTSFEYSNLQASGGIDDDLRVSVTVTNTGSRAGAETVLFFTFDSFRSPTPEYKRLRAFDKVVLQPQESTTVHATVPLDDLRFVGPHDDTHYILDYKMKGWLGMGPQTDCRMDPKTNPLCVRLQATHPDRPYVAACEAACTVWKQSHCMQAYHWDVSACLKECMNVPPATTSSLDNGWGWNYVNCLESVVWELQEDTNTMNLTNCWQMTTKCRNVFQTSPFLPPLKHGASSLLFLHKTALVWTGHPTYYHPYQSIVTFAMGVFVSLLIFHFLSGNRSWCQDQHPIATPTETELEPVVMTNGNSKQKSQFNHHPTTNHDHDPSVLPIPVVDDSYEDDDGDDDAVDDDDDSSCSGHHCTRNPNNMDDSTTNPCNNGSDSSHQEQRRYSLDN